MKVAITYCVRWGYLPEATRWAAHLERTLGLRAELVRGVDGVFDVDVDGARVFSKHAAGRFPSPEEVERAIRAQAGKPAPEKR